MKLPWWYPPILAYHRVIPEARTDTPALHPDSFALQMQILAERFHPIPLAALADYLEGKGTLPKRAVAVTFDDGTDDHFSYAFPVLAQYRIPATIFLITGQIGQPGFLSVDQIIRMAREGISFGSHGLDHEYLPSLSGPDLQRPLSESKRAIESLGIPAEFVSYPGGGFTAQTIEAAQTAGYRGGCTTNRGERRFPPDRWALRRITMHRSGSSAWGMWLRCCGYYGLNRRLRSPASCRAGRASDIINPL